MGPLNRPRGHHHGYETPSWSALASSIAVLTLVVGSSYWTYQLVNSYGWEGSLRYIWDGDPEPQRLRDRKGTLLKVEKKLNRITTVLSSLEEGLERARLDSVDGLDPSHIRELWAHNVPNKDLRQNLALLSYDLDQIASTIDQIVSSGEENIKAIKKTLSSRVVELMGRADLLIVAYNQV
jgi:hypothetical protein